METKVNYTLVGLFVLLLSVAGIIVTVWMVAGVSNQQYDWYRVYINESVAGLSIKAPVKYNGVDVGYVDSIQLNPNNPQQIVLTLAIDDTVKIHTDTTATLMVQGLTGIAYIGLKGGSAQAPVLHYRPGKPYPVIKNEHSFFFRLDTAVQQLTVTLTGISADLKTLLDADNRQTFKETLQNLNELLANSAKASQQLPSLMNHLGKSANSVQQVSQQLQNLTSQANTTLQVVTEQTLPQTFGILQNLQQGTNNLQQLTERLQQNPAVLLRGQQLPPPGPGE